MSVVPSPRSDAVMKALQHAIDEAKLAYAFRAGSYTMSALNAVLAVEQVYLLEADRAALRLDYRHDTASNHPTTNPARTPCQSTP